MKTKNLLLALLFLGLATSCTKDKDDDATITAADLQMSAKLDGMNDDIAEMSEDFTTNSQYGVTVQRAAAPFANSPWHPCNGVTTVTTTSATGIITHVRTADYGTTNCPMPNGNLLKGKIIFTFVRNPSSQTVNVSFDNFYHNNFKIEGTKTFVRTMTVATATSPSHPIVNVTLNLTAINQLNGNVYTRTGTRVREFIQGYPTPFDWTDNEYKFTGSWTTTHPNGNVQVATITTPVIAKLGCANSVAIPRPSIWAEGVISFSRGTNVATLNFGTGTCDNEAVFTLNGTSRTITIN